MKTIYYPGVWDLLHVGHVRALKQAKKALDQYGQVKLVVGIASDKVVCEDKQHNPVMNHLLRKEMLNSLEVVDLAIIYFELDFIQELRVIAPDFLAVGEQWGDETRHQEAEKFMMEFHEEESIHARLIRTNYTTGISSTSIRKSLKQQRKKY